MSELSRQPPDLPEPEDDGAADHLHGAELPDLELPSTGGGTESLAVLGEESLVAYVYPRTGEPGEPLPEGWDAIPGARGCTPQSCAYRDAAAEFGSRGVRLAGISAQTPAEQESFAAREGVPYPLLADPNMEVAAALGLPTFEAAGMTLYRRLTFLARGGRIARVRYPVFPPDRDAAASLAWLDGGGRN